MTYKYGWETYFGAHTDEILNDYENHHGSLERRMTINEFHMASFAMSLHAIKHLMDRVGQLEAKIKNLEEAK